MATKKTTSAASKTPAKAPIAGIGKAPAAAAAPARVAAAPARPAAPAVASTPVRNTPIPKAAPVSIKKEITHEMIAKRAYEISQSATAGSQEDNWHRAEHEFHGV